MLRVFLTNVGIDSIALFCLSYLKRIIIGFLDTGYFCYVNHRIQLILAGAKPQPNTTNLNNVANPLDIF